MNPEKKKKTLAKVLFVSVAALCMSIPALSMADESVEPKGLVIQNYGVTQAQYQAQPQYNNSNPYSQLQVGIKTNKSQYNVGDQVKFYVQGNQRFFLWLFSIDDYTGQATMIIPGSLQKGNQIDGGRTYTLPSGSRKLRVGSQGNKRIVMIASTKWLSNMDLSRYNFSENQGYYRTAPKNIDVMLKGLQLVNNQSAGSPNFGNQVVVHKFNLPVSNMNGYNNQPGYNTGAPAVGFSGSIVTAPNTGMNQAPVVFVNQSNSVYRVGDMVKIVYGANKPGWVQLFVQYPSGQTEFLKKQYVDGRTNYALYAKAVPPLGPQTVMAVFNPQEAYSFPIGQVQQYSNYTYRAKGLQLQEPTLQNGQRPNYGMSRFFIQ